MTYVLSDIHGNERRFNSIMKQIEFCAEDELYILGDVIDRHPGGLRLLYRLMKMPNVHMLLGNHEYMMLRALGYPYDSDDDLSEREMQFEQKMWYRNGGAVTHQYWKRIRKDRRREIIEYLRCLPLNMDIEVNGKSYKLVHGAPVEDYDSRSEYENATQHAVWKRLRLRDLDDQDNTLIFGHTPTEHYQDGIPMSVLKYGYGIGIDCGSGYPETDYYGQRGRLACLRLDDGKAFYSVEEGQSESVRFY